MGETKKGIGDDCLASRATQCFVPVHQGRAQIQRQEWPAVGNLSVHRAPHCAVIFWIALSAEQKLKMELRLGRSWKCSLRRSSPVQSLLLLMIKYPTSSSREEGLFWLLV